MWSWISRWKNDELYSCGRPLLKNYCRSMNLFVNPFVFKGALSWILLPQNGAMATSCEAAPASLIVNLLGIYSLKGSGMKETVIIAGRSTILPALLCNEASWLCGRCSVSHKIPDIQFLKGPRLEWDLSLRVLEGRFHSFPFHSW